MHSSVPLIVFIPADKLTNGESSSVMGDICKKYVSLPLTFIRPDPHGARDRRPSAVRGQATAARRDGRRLHPLSLRLAGVQTGENQLSVEIKTIDLLYLLQRFFIRLPL